MKKSIKLSIAMALMVGASAGFNAVAPQTASAEISDKFRMEMNGVTSYIMNKDGLGGYAKQDKNGDYAHGYWNHYNRLVIKYFADKNVTLTTRLHSGYDAVGDFYANDNTYGAYFDQAWLDFKDRKANVTYSLGKMGMVLGQSMLYNSTGRHTGGKISIGNWYDPQSLQVWYVDDNSGRRTLAAQASKELFKGFQMTATYLHRRQSRGSSSTEYYVNNKDIQKASTTGTGTTKVNNRTKYSNQGQFYDLRNVDVGFKATTPGITMVAEYTRNTASSSRISNRATSDDKRAFFVELYTGPTSDMTSGLPLQKPGTSVWSLKYQDIGANAVGPHNTTFFDDAKGWRLNYGHTFRKGLAGDIAVARMKDKGSNNGGDPANGKWKTYVAAEIAYKFK